MQLLGNGIMAGMDPIRVKKPRVRAKDLAKADPFPDLPGADAFTAHNIRLDDGTQTLPELGWLIEDSTLLHAVRRTLNLIYPQGLQGRSIVDCGCLEGGFTAEFARMGMQATGIEARENNFRNCMRVKDGTRLPNLRFVQDDVKNIGNYGPFDAVFASGMLYHLDRPRQFLTDVARVCRRVIFLETHVASDLDVPATELFGLSPLVEHEGLKGRWMLEYDDSVSRARLERMKWSAWSNASSFWIQKEHLLQLLRDLGFDLVMEQYDNETDIIGFMTGVRRQQSRVFLVGIRSTEAELG